MCYICLRFTKFDNTIIYMKLFIPLAIFFLALAGCGKEKFSSEPKITFNYITPNTYKNGLALDSAGPILSLQLTDKEGDFGFNDNEDTSYVYVKNLTIPPFNVDSLKFPTAAGIRRSNLDAEILVDLKRARGILTGSDPAPFKPYVDTLYFEVYVKDFAGNKSNVLKTEKPVFYTTR